MGNSADWPGQPLDDQSFDGKTFTFVNVAWQPMCIDIHREEEPKPQPRIQAFNYNERYMNQIWLLRRENAGADWSLQNIGTGFFLAQDEETGRRLLASKNIEYFRPRMDNDGTILLFSTRGDWTNVAALKGGGFGEEVTTIPYSQHEDKEIRWIFKEYHLTSGELIMATEARKVAESARASAASGGVNGVAEPPSSAAQVAGAALQTAAGETVDDEETVVLLNEIGGCPAGFAWHRIEGGFRCGGGTHFVYDAALAAHT